VANVAKKGEWLAINVEPFLSKSSTLKYGASGVNARKFRRHENRSVRRNTYEPPSVTIITLITRSEQFETGRLYKSVHIAPPLFFKQRPYKGCGNLPESRRV
jgi:hypothetical protein